MQRNRVLLWFIILVTATSTLIDLPKLTVPYLNREIGGYNIDFFLFGKRIFRNLAIRQGLDIQGGVQVELQADMGAIAQQDRTDALSSAKEVVNRRIDAFGVTEPNIFTTVSGDDYRIVVELPGVTDTQQAVKLIGQTAQLDFREPKTEEELKTGDVPPPQVDPFKKTNLTGKDLKRAQVTFNQRTGEPQVQLIFNDEGAKKFADITGRNVGKKLAIYLDNRPITAPVVNQKITGGDAVITGKFTIEEARQLAIQLNAGALPVPVKVVKQQNIGPTLGQESVSKSIQAGLVGLLLVAVFMIGYYKRIGILAVTGLVIYGLITLALYKLIPVTLTLSGIAGFILSVGMAVDANILIFERMKEELRAGKKLQAAMELGFGRAWDSIRDANVATLITVFVLFNPFEWNFLVTSGMVRGFALTLGLGILISLFTGVVVTRTLIRVFYKTNQ